MGWLVNIMANQDQKKQIAFTYYNDGEIKKAKPQSPLVLAEIKICGELLDANYTRNHPGRTEMLKGLMRFLFGRSFQNAEGLSPLLSSIDSGLAVFDSSFSIESAKLIKQVREVAISKLNPAVLSLENLNKKGGKDE